MEIVSPLFGKFKAISSVWEEDIANLSVTGSVVELCIPWDTLPYLIVILLLILQ